MVPSERDEHGAGFDDRARRFLSDAVVVHGFMRVARHVAAIEDADVLTVQQRLTKIEIPIFDPAKCALPGPTNGRRCVGLVVGDFFLLIRCAIGQTQNSDMGPNFGERIKIEQQRRIEERMELKTRSNGK